MRFLENSRWLHISLIGLHLWCHLGWWLSNLAITIWFCIAIDCLAIVGLFLLWMANTSCCIVLSWLRCLAIICVSISNWCWTLESTFMTKCKMSLWWVSWYGATWHLILMSTCLRRSSNIELVVLVGYFLHGKGVLGAESVVWCSWVRSCPAKLLMMVQNNAYTWDCSCAISVRSYRVNCCICAFSLSMAGLDQFIHIQRWNMLMITSNWLLFLG